MSVSLHQSEGFDLIWTRLKSGIWWPASINTVNIQENDCFAPYMNTFPATLLGCDKTVHLLRNPDPSPSGLQSQGEIYWETGDSTEKHISQEVEDSLVTSYRLALSSAALKFPKYFKNPEKYSSITATTSIGAIKRYFDDVDKGSYEHESSKEQKINEEFLCQPVKAGPYNGKVSKRSNVISWDDYFMAVAFLSSMRSKDPSTQVGACIVNEDKRIVGIGYNGFPRGCSDDDLPWDRQAENELDTKYPYVCHAEVNAILNKNSADVKGCMIYVALFPCNECTKIIIQSGIKEVVYLSDKYHDTIPLKASRRMLDLAGVKYRHYKPSQDEISVKFIN